MPRRRCRKAQRLCPRHTITQQRRTHMRASVSSPAEISEPLSMTCTVRGTRFLPVRSAARRGVAGSARRVDIRLEASRR